MSVFYLEAAHLLEQTGIVGLEDCVSQVGMHEHEFENMRSIIQRIRQQDREWVFFTGYSDVDIDEPVTFDDWLDTFEERLEEKINQMQ
jgi:hypothetical protein